MESVDVLDKLSLGVCDVGGFVKVVLVGYIIRGEVSNLPKTSHDYP